MLLDTCPRCHTSVHPRKRSVGWRLALPVWAGGFVLMVLAAGTVGPFIIGLLPVLMATGLAMGPLLSIIYEEPTCPTCGRSLAAPPTEREFEQARSAEPLATSALDLAA